MSKRKHIWRIKGLIREEDFKAILAFIPQHCNRFVYGLTYRDQQIYLNYQRGKIKELPETFGEIRYLSITNPDQDAMFEAYTKISNYLIADRSYDFISRVG